SVEQRLPHVRTVFLLSTNSAAGVINAGDHVNQNLTLKLHRVLEVVDVVVGGHITLSGSGVDGNSTDLIGLTTKGGVLLACRCLDVVIVRSGKLKEFDGHLWSRWLLGWLGVSIIIPRHVIAVLARQRVPHALKALESRFAD